MLAELSHCESRHLRLDDYVSTVVYRHYQQRARRDLASGASAHGDGPLHPGPVSSDVTARALRLAPYVYVPLDSWVWSHSLGGFGHRSSRETLIASLTSDVHHLARDFYLGASDASDGCSVLIPSPYPRLDDDGMSAWKRMLPFLTLDRQ